MDSSKLQQTRELYHFGAFRLDVAEHRFWCDDEPIPLTPKQFDLLFYFVEHAGHVMKKSELLDAIWTDTFIEETTLARNVSLLRKAIGESADGESIIETVPKIGYRFTAKVTRSADEENELIIEEQTVRYFCGEETMTFDEADVMRFGEKQISLEEENTNFLPQNAPLRFSRSFYTPLLLFVTLGLAILAGISFINYTKNLQPAGLNVN